MSVCVCQLQRQLPGGSDLSVCASWPHLVEDSVEF